MRAALDAIQAKAGMTDQGVSKVLGLVFDWLPELFDRAALEVALEELDPNGDAWFTAEKPESAKVVRRVIQRKEALYAGVGNVFRALASAVDAKTMVGLEGGNG
jgi:hypothetical protein